jgi:alcohol dehydrogenase (NADP+)
VIEGERRKPCHIFRFQSNITADVEVISIQQVNEAYERMLKSDVKYRFSIDMASLKS